jgi:8-oxo-dGTP diphosphatase
LSQILIEMDSGRYCYEYPRPAVSADIVVFGFNGLNIRLLLIKRGQEPYKDNWALPGGFLEMDETIENCAKRELYEETALQYTKVEQLYTFSSLGRDPRGRVLTIAFWTIIHMNQAIIKAGDDAAQAGWFNLNSLPELAFDHSEIIQMALKKLINLNKINVEDISARFDLNPNFDLPAFQKAMLTLIPLENQGE